MSRTTKKVQGQLLDISSNTLLSAALVTITLVDPQRSDDRPRYEASLIVDGYKPELDNKSYLLKLGDGIVGEIFISISTRELPGLQTHFIINLQGKTWSNLDWFENI